MVIIMSWLDDTKILTAIVLSAALVGACAGAGLTGMEVPDFVITWANMGFQFLLGISATVVGVKTYKEARGEE